MNSFHFHTLVTFLYASFALGDTVFLSPTTPEDIEKKEHEIVSHEYESGFFQKGTCSTPVFTSKKENEIDSKDIPSPGLDSSGITECQGKLVLKHSHVREGTSEKPSAGDVATVAISGDAVEVLTPSGNKMIVHNDGQVERWNKESGKWEPYSSGNGSADDIENMLKVLEGNGDKHGKGLFKEVLEALSECSENTAGAFSEGKKVCVTDKLKKELKKKKAAENSDEAERLRQQQLAEQRKKSKAQQKKSDKKSNKVSTKEKPKQTQSTQPKKTTPTTTQPNNPAQTVSIDFSTMESCLDQQISIVRGILNSGEKATDAQVSKLNSLVNQYKSEKVNIQSKINSISNSSERSAAQSKFNTIENRKKSVLVPLRQQAASSHLFQNGSL